MPIIILIILLSFFFFYKAIVTRNFVHIITSLTILVFTSQVEIIQYWLAIFSFLSFMLVLSHNRNLFNWKPYFSFLFLVIILFIIDSSNLLSSSSFPPELYKTKVMYFYITLISYFSIFYFVIKNLAQFRSVLINYFVIYFVQVVVTGFAKYAGLDFLDVLFAKELYEISLLSSIEEYLTLKFRFYDAFRNSPIELCLILFPVVFFPVLKKSFITYFLSIISFTIIFLTLSRTGFVSLLFFAIFYAFFRNKKNLFGFLVSILVISIIVYTVLQINISAIDERLASIDNVNVRIETMTAYVKNVFSINNLFGYSENSDFFFREFKLPYAISSENLYLTILLEKGLVGGGMLFIYILMTINRLRKVSKLYKDNKDKVSFVFFFESVVYTSLLILFSFYYSPNDIHFWFLLVMSNIFFGIEVKSKKPILQLY